jgi:hypothetical protein
VASGNKVTLTFAGDESDLTRSIDTVGRSSRDMADTVGESASHIDRVGESADNAEGKFTGLASGIDGVTTLMDDPSPQEFAQAIADMADGVANFAVPAIKQLSTLVAENARAAVVAAGQHVAAAARTVAAWVAMGVQAMLNAAKMAAAWLISLGPVALVIAAVAAVIAILVALGVGFDDIANAAEAVWNFILNTVQGFIAWLQANWPLVLAIITGPIGLAVLAIVSHWETIKAGFTAVKDWIAARIGDVVSFFTGMPGRLQAAAGDLWGWIGRSFKTALNSVITAWNNFKIPSITIGGWDPPGPGPSFPSFHTPEINTPNIPLLHSGGVFRAPPGQREGLALLLDGEPVGRPGTQMGGNVIVYVQGSIRSDRDLVALIRDELKRGGLR